MPGRQLGIARKNPNDLLTAGEFNIILDAVESSVSTAADLNLQNVNNTSDANKPISIATQAALNNKQNNLGFTPENPNNKVVDLLTPNHTTYPTTLAVSNAIFEAISDGDVVIVDADATTKGKIRLTGDLGGTADSPTVPGLATKQDILPVGTTSQYRRGDNSLATLSTDVVSEGTTNKYLTSTEKSKLSGISAGATVNDSDVNLKNRANHTGTQSADTIIDGTTNKVLTSSEKTKLSGIAVGATANSADATLLARASHTGTQSADTLTDGTTNKLYTAAEKTKLAAIPTGATANDTDANLKNRANHTGTQSTDTLVDGTTSKVFTSANQTKLSGIATAATANSTDAQLRTRSTHTGTQAQSTVDNLVSDLASKQATLTAGTTIKTLGGISPLGSGDINVAIKDGDGKILEADLPTFELMDYMNSDQFVEDVDGKASIKEGFKGLLVDGFLSGFSHAWHPQFGTVTVQGIGIAAANNTGSVARAAAVDTYLSSEPRVGLVTAATAGSRANMRDTVLKYNSKWGFKGFARLCQTGAADIPTLRTFFGFTTDTGGLNNVNPSTLTSILGVAQDAEDTNLQVMHNDSSGVATKIDLGVNFPAKTRNADIYDCYIHCYKGGALAKVTVQRISADTGNILFETEVTINTNLPDLTTLLSAQIFVTNGATAAIAELDYGVVAFNLRGE